MMKRNICFLFGAGAESSFKICNGNEFAKKTLRLDAKDSKVIEKAIKKHYKTKLDTCENKDWYPSYRGARFDIDNLLNCSVKKLMHDEIEKPKSKRSFEEDVKQKAKNYKETNSAIDIICKYPNYMGILDENFHTLISPKTLGPYKFWRVIVTYTSAYLAVCMDILRISPDEKEKIYALLSEPKATYQRIESTIDESILNEDSYYKVLGDNGGNLNYNIITTNYSPVCEKALLHAHKHLKQDKFKRSHIAYIHGKLNWFECPYTLQVYDTQDDADQAAFNNCLLFPYIFIQSGIKPVVERKQMHEYSKALAFFDEADEMVILGYNLNVDDNHLNSLLHSFLSRDGNKVTYFSYDNEVFIEQHLKERLRISESERVNVEIIYINEQNGYQILKKYLERRTEEQRGELVN